MEPRPTYGWLVLRFPLAGSMIIAFGWRLLPGRSARAGSGPRRSASPSSARSGRWLMLLDEPAEARQLTDSLYDYASAAGLDIQLGDPRRPALGLHVPGGDRRLDADPSLLGRLHGLRPRLPRASSAYLNFFVFSMLLLVLAGNFVLLIVGWAFVGFASYALISFWYRRETATKAGMKAFVINVVGDVGLVLAAFFVFRELGTFDFLESFEAAPRDVHQQRGRRGRDLLPDAGRRLREVGPAAAPHLASRRDGGPDPGLGADPRRDHGHRRRLSDRPHVPVLRARADGGRHRRLRRPRDPDHRGDDRARRHRPEADHRLLDDEPDRLHGHRRLDRRLHRGPLPPDDPRLLQGAAVHGRRLGDRRDGEQPEHRPDERLSPGAAADLVAADRRRPRPRRVPRHVGLLLQGRDPRLRRRARRDVLDLRDRRLRRPPS